MPPDEIFEFNQFVEYIKTNIGIQEELIQQALQILIEQKKLIAVEKAGRVFYRKMDLR
jgi:hypothetical protein